MRSYLSDTRIEELPGRFVAVTAEMATGHETWLTKGDLADAIEAAYALPGVFPPRNVNGRWLIDGALVNPLPVSVCRALGARLVIAVGLHADAFGRASVQRREKYEPSSEELLDERVAQKNAWRWTKLYVAQAVSTQRGHTRSWFCDASVIQYHNGPRHTVAPCRRSC